MTRRRRTKLPDVIHVLGVPFTVEWNAPISEEDYGETKIFARSIRIGQSCDSSEKRASTLLHELIHAALGTAGHDEILGDKTEEALVVCLEHALMPLLQTILDVSNADDPS